MKRFFIITLVALTVIASYLSWQYNRTLITIENVSGETMEDVIIEVRNNLIEIKGVPTNQKRSFVLEKEFGESGVKLTYTVSGEKRYWEGGYIESSGGYRALLEVKEDHSVDFQVSSPF